MLMRLCDGTLWKASIWDTKNINQSQCLSIFCLLTVFFLAQQHKLKKKKKNTVSAATFSKLGVSHF